MHFDQLRRREFIALLIGTLVAWSHSALAQQTVKHYRIGILSPDLPPPGFLEAFRQGLGELGYVEGQDVAFEVRSAEGYSQRLAALANHLVELKVNVIIAINTPSVQAARKASATIPIVMTRVADPVKSGLVSSLSRPGGNITGLSFRVDELSGKRLALLKEASPSVSRVAVLWFEPNPGADIAVGAIKAASRELGLQLLLLPVLGPADLKSGPSRPQPEVGLKRSLSLMMSSPPNTGSKSSVWPRHTLWLSSRSTKHSLRPAHSWPTDRAPQPCIAERPTMWIAS